MVLEIMKHTKCEICEEEGALYWSKEERKWLCWICHKECKGRKS